MHWLLSKAANFAQTSLYALSTILLLAISALYLKQDSLLYYPAIGDMPLSPGDNPKLYRNPGEQGMEYENCRITTDDGVVIHAWLVLHQDSVEKKRRE